MDMELVDSAEIMPGDTVGSDANATRVNGPRARHAVAQVTAPSQVLKGSEFSISLHADMVCIEYLRRHLHLQYAITLKGEI
jgi:hypothetical protein